MKPHPLISLIPLAVLFVMLYIAIALFGSDALSGASQLALLMASGVCVLLSMIIYRTSWTQFEESIKKTIGDASASIIILLLIGTIGGTWMISGVVPTMIYYGLQIMSPRFFLFCSCIICALVSLMTGSSWTTVATIGVALLGIGNALGIPTPWTVGAIISGGYFGDKVSPLSDTTTLAASSAETDLFTHIRFMLRTTVPTMCITLTIFFVAGFRYGGSTDLVIHEYLNGLQQSFHISIWTLMVPLLTAILIAKKTPAMMTLFASSLIAAICAVILQSDVLLKIAGSLNGDGTDILRGIMITAFTATHVDTGFAPLNELVSTGGMAGMLDTVWLILCAMTYGGVMVASGMLFSITSVILRFVHHTFGLVAATTFSGILLNIVTSDQYISIILSASMYKDAYKKMGHEPCLLSRSTEDSATVTSPLIPWTTCGMTQSTILGVPTLVYAPFCFFNWISPIMTCVMAIFVGRKHDKKINETT